MDFSEVKFSAEPVPKDVLLKLVDAARYSPSGNNVDHRRFIIVTRREALDRLSRTHTYCHWLTSATAAIAIVVDPSSTRYWLEDACLAAYTIWLAAAERGLGAAWGAMHLADDVEETRRRQQYVCQVLSIPHRYQVPMVLGIGYPLKPPPEKSRPPLTEIAFWEHYPDGSP
jgi:nitroreductase